MKAKPSVLDASAVLALLQAEPGAEVVQNLLPGAVISAVNLAEVLHKLVSRGMPEDMAREALDGLALEVIPFGGDAAYASVRFIHPQLSLGDRVCLATSFTLGGQAV